MKNALILAAITLLFAGCQSTGVIPLSSDTYMISKTSAAGAFADMGKLKAQVIREANAFAESKGKVAVAMASNTVRPIAGGMPSFEYQFRLVDKDDPRASGAILKKGADIVIEDRRK